MRYRINERNTGDYTLESERKSRRKNRVSQQRADTESAHYLSYMMCKMIDKMGYCYPSYLSSPYQEERDVLNHWIKNQVVEPAIKKTPHGDSEIYRLVDSLSIKICLGLLEMTYPELKEEAL